MESKLLALMAFGASVMTLWGLVGGESPADGV